MALGLPERFDGVELPPASAWARGIYASYKAFSTQGLGGWALGPCSGTPASFLGCFSWAVGLGPGFFRQVLDDPTGIMVFLLFSPAKEQYFIPGRRVGEARLAWVG